MALTRVEKALTGLFTKPAQWFVHSVTPDKPIGPDTSSLSAPDLDRFNEWLANRMGGSSTGEELVNMTPELSAMISSYETYIATPAFRAWASTDTVSREMQWRLIHVDVADAVDKKGTIPPSFSGSGTGTEAPGVPDIVVSPETLESTGSTVSTGGKSAEVVFGDDGDIVTTGE